MEWSLEGLKRKKGKSRLAPTKICTGCHCHLALAARICPECGQEVEGGATRGQLTTVAGELVELSPEMMEARRKQRGLELKNARTKRDLVQLGRDRKYKNPEFWADKILEDRRQWAEKRNSYNQRQL